MFKIATGSQVVTLVETRVSGTHEGEFSLVPTGTVAEIVLASDSETYRVRIQSGEEFELAPSDFILLSKFKIREGIDLDTISHRDDELVHRVIYRCVVGSRAYGLEDENSDIDYRGIYLPPADLHWSLHGVPEQLDREATQESYWELEKFIRLSLKANPNVLESLFSPIVLHATPLAQELIAIRKSFLSQLVYQTFHGYVISQFNKLQTVQRNHGKMQWKHVMHLIRLLLSGISILREGDLVVQVSEHREQLMKIKRGELAWKECNEWRVRLHKELDDAFQTTKLPERPNIEAANAFLIKARRLATQESLP